MTNPITEQDVLAAQENWGEAIVAIGEAENPETEAQSTLDELYAYDISTVLFKPTLASEVPFRGTESEALSYFVGGIISEDGGFALAPYTDVRFENEGIITYDDTALSMGEYFFTQTDGSEIKAEYSFGYVRDENGELKINLQHSSLPYVDEEPAETVATVSDTNEMEPDFSTSQIAELDYLTSPITEQDVLAAQENWGEAIVAIGEAENPEAEAQSTLDELYAYDISTVLFKPTLASEVPFRGTESEALSYFVGGIISEDGGFALAPYTDVRFENEGIITYDDTAISMGEYFFTQTDGSEIKAEYSFGYVRDENGELKINLQHSSLPYVDEEPAETVATVFGTNDADILDSVLDTNDFIGDGQILFAGGGDDTVDTTFAPGGNRIDLGSGNDTYFGGSGDRVLAGSGDDILFLNRGAGANVVTGQEGADQFWVATDSVDLPEAASVITDFVIGEDKIGFAATSLNYSDLMLEQNGSSTIVKTDSNEFAELLNIEASVLSADDFVFFG